MTLGRSLELFFIDGQPDGLLTAELFNWTGHVLHVPRTRLKQALARREAGYTGVYLLLGEDENGPLAYVGESEDIGARLKSHAAEKDWWDRAILITTGANALHKAHVKYLESRLVELALAAGNTPLENANTPPRSSLSEAAQANMEAFLENLRIVLPAIGIDLLSNQTRPAEAASAPADDATAFVLIASKAGVRARAVLKDGEMIVQAGSTVRTDWVGKGSANSGYHKLRQPLIDSGVIRIGSDAAVFEENYAFSSPSAAVAVVLGRASNGRIEWHVEGRDMTYKAWEEAQLQAVEPTP